MKIASGTHLGPYEIVSLMAKAGWGKCIDWAEVHWFEAHGIGKKEIKVKRIL